MNKLIFIYLLYIPVSAKTGLDFQTYNNGLALLSSYNSNEIIPKLGMTAYDYYVLHPNLFENSRFIYCLLQLLSYFPVLTVAFIFLGKELIADVKRFFKNIKKNIIVILLSYAALIYLGNIVGMIYGLLGDTGSSANEGLINLLLTSNGKWFMIISVCILAPISEEIIFRKLIFGTCEEKFHFKPWLTILISALIFSFVHVTDVASFKYIFQYLALAIPICSAYHFSENNITTSLIIHVINNIVSVVETMVLGSLVFKI